MSAFPTSDDYAIALVAACKETGEPVIETASGMGKRRARHYAMHALVRVFPKADPVHVAMGTGTPSNPKNFWQSSLHQVFKPRPHGGRMAYWWNEGAFERVITSILADRTRRAIAPKEIEEIVEEEETPEPPRRAPPEPPLREAPTIKREARRPDPPYRGPVAILDTDDRPVFDRGKFHEPPLRYDQSMPTSKADLQAQLREAVRNTAARGAEE